MKVAVGKGFVLVPNSKVSVKNTGFITKARRVALFFIVGVLTFGLFEPGANYALAVSNATLKPAKVAVAPLENAAQSNQGLLGSGVENELLTTPKKVDKTNRKEETSKKTAFVRS